MMSNCSVSTVISVPLYFAEQNAVARLNVRVLARAVRLVFAFADGDDFALLRLFLRGVRDDDAAAHLLTLFYASHDHTILQWFDVDSHSNSPFKNIARYV
jgi:hypothetical protein